MRLTTKVWLVVSGIALVIVLASSYVSIDRRVDQRVEEARRFNLQLYEGVQLSIDMFGASFADGGLAVFSAEDVQRFLTEDNSTNISLVEVYLSDGTRVFTTDDGSSPSQASAEGLQGALAGETSSGIRELSSGVDGGRSDSLGLFRLLRGGEFADEVWGPMRGPDGEIIGATRAVIGLPGLRDEAVAIVRESMAFGMALILGVWAVLGVALHVLIKRPLADLTATTRRIREEDIRVRATVRSGDELGELAVSFNAMADDLESQATRDSLTGLLNHRYGTMALDEALDQARSLGDAVSVLIGDIDGFKHFNDTYGHLGGDEVLKQVAGALRKLCAGSATPCRYGGDEFLIIIPGADKDACAAFTDRLVRELGRLAFQTREGTSVPIRMSLGGASFPEESQYRDHLLAMADSAMYEAKRVGATSLRGSDAAAEASDRREGVLSALCGVVQSVQNRDNYTLTHSDAVAESAVKLASRIGLPDEEVQALRVAGVLHDVGKMVIPDDILRKPGALTEEERVVVERHPLVGELLVRLGPFGQDIVQAVGHHHEWYDGSGYPRGLAGDEIPLLGRIMAIADAYSAMTLDRPYRAAFPPDEIIDKLKAGAGTQFEPRLVDAFVEMLKAERQDLAA